MDEGLLIHLVQKYSIIYDKSRKDYKDNQKKENAWESVASAMAVSVEDCKRVSKNLRERFAKERRLIKCVPSGSAATESTWPYYLSLMFLEKHIQNRRTTSNVPSASQSHANSTTESQNFAGTSTRPWDSFQTVMGETQELGETQESIQLATESENVASTAATAVPSTRKRKLSEGSTCRGSLDFPKKDKENVRTLLAGAIHDVTNLLTTKRPVPVADVDMSFGTFVGLSLQEMPGGVKQKKKMAIMEILTRED